MTTFTASNGIRIEVDPKPNAQHPLCVVGLGLLPSSVDALREFFQHERDTELGRWRWPENPDMHVHMYSRDDGVVLHERTVETYTFDRQSIDKLRGVEPVSDFARAARAYFDAHPEPKPWHGAKNGEVWLLTFSGFETSGPSPWTACPGRLSTDPPEFVYPQNGGTLALTDPEIVDGRRIWPEATS